MAQWALHAGCKAGVYAGCKAGVYAGCKAGVYACCKEANCNKHHKQNNVYHNTEVGNGTEPIL